MNEYAIGIFDSGIGGVSVLKELIKKMPNENYIYLSDSLNNPYGDKDHNDLLDICKKNVECLLKSIPLKEITEDMPKDTRYYKVNHTDSLMKKYDIKELPSLLLFKNNKLLGKIEGYYPTDEKEKFLSLINDIVNK